jgi:hypothetical protein
LRRGTTGRPGASYSPNFYIHAVEAAQPEKAVHGYDFLAFAASMAPVGETDAIGGKVRAFLGAET